MRSSAWASPIWVIAPTRRYRAENASWSSSPRAIAQNARTIIMDEPTSALDYGNTVRVLSTVRQLAREGMSIVQSTHQPDQAFLYADQTLVINDGRVHAFGNPKDVITKELVSTIYDVDVEVNSLYGDKVRVCVPVREIER